jgi:hypothetical protein
MKKLFFLGLFFVLGKVSYCDIIPPIRMRFINA